MVHSNPMLAFWRWANLGVPVASKVPYALLQYACDCPYRTAISALFATEEF
jgi:hypothetical protein